MNTSRSILILLAALLALLALAACGGQATPTPAPATTPTAIPTLAAPTAAPTEAPTATPMAALTEAPAAAAPPTEELATLRANPWQWVSFTSPVETFEVETPDNYTVAFNTDAFLAITADCNNAAGSYQGEGGKLTVEIGPMTAVACPPESRSDQFVKLLGSSALYFFQDGNLHIDLLADGGTMVFAPAASTPSEATTTVEASNIPRLRELDFSPFEKELAAFTPERAAAVDAIVKDADIAQVQDAVKAGTLTYTELTLYFLARIQQYDETLRTMIELNPDALKEAQAADQLLKDGKATGLMFGIPVTLKDNIETAAPMHTAGGSEILLNHVPDVDASFVQAAPCRGRRHPRQGQPLRTGRRGHHHAARRQRGRRGDHEPARRLLGRRLQLGQRRRHGGLPDDGQRRLRDRRIADCARQLERRGRHVSGQRRCGRRERDSADQEQ